MVRTQERMSSCARCSGIGQAGSLFLGQDRLNQPLSESELMREGVASNIGETGDEEISRLAVNRKIVVTVSAGVPVYIVLQQTPRTNRTPGTASARSLLPATATNVDQLRPLLSCRQELSQPTAVNQPAQ